MDLAVLSVYLRLHRAPFPHLLMVHAPPGVTDHGWAPRRQAVVQQGRHRKVHAEGGGHRFEPGDPGAARAAAAAAAA